MGAKDFATATAGESRPYTIVWIRFRIVWAISKSKKRKKSMQTFYKKRQKNFARAQNRTRDL